MRTRALILIAIAMSTVACDGTAMLGTITSKESVQYNGTISGNAFVTVNGTDLRIVNMKVEVRVKDAFADTVVGSGVTGEGGRFEIAYQLDSTASSIELYLHFIAESGDGMIRVRRKLPTEKKTRFQDVLYDTPLVADASSPRLDSEQGLVELDSSELKPQLLHWASRARQFVTAELGSSSPLPTDPATPLDILTPPLGFDGAGTFFVPATSIDAIVSLALLGLIPLFPPLAVGMLAYVNIEFSDHDALYISTDEELDDGTTMHEFGHYVMWYAQGKKWLNPLEASFAHHYTYTNSANSKIAWTEGFADGFARIVDDWSSMDDGETDGDRPSSTPEVAGTFGTPTCGPSAGTTCNGQATSHGYFSEQYIDHVVFDLWDGPTNMTSGPNGSTRTVISDDYDDHLDGGFDNIELSFAEIMQPILDTMTGDQDSLVDNIIDYHDRLYALQHNRSIKDLFVADKIKNLQTSAGTNPALQDVPNTDAISVPRMVEVELYKVNSAGVITRSIGTQFETFRVDVPAMLSTADSYNLGATAISNVTLSDDLTLGGSSAQGNATLTFNSRTQPLGWRRAGNMYGQPAGTTYATGTALAVSLASGMHLLAKNRGTIVLGEAANGQQATVTVQAGATLELGGGAGGPYPERDPITGAMLSKGKVYIKRGSKLIIERGATLIINPGAELTLDGIGAELIIRGDLQVKQDATFWWTATNGAMVTFDLPRNNGAPNVTFQANAQILIDEVEFTIASSSYLQPNDGLPSRITIRNGARGHFGSNAYLGVPGYSTLTLTDSTIGGSSTPQHFGIMLNGGPNTIDNATFQSGQRCLGDAQRGAPLVVTNSTFTSCTTGIDVTGADLTLFGSTVTGGSTGVQTTGSNSVGIVNSTISGAKVGWHLKNRGDVGQELSNTTIGGAAQYGVLLDGTTTLGAPPVSIGDSTVTGSGTGVRSVGVALRIERSTIRNSGIGVEMMNNAVLDLSGAAAAVFSGNTTSVSLYYAPRPLLDGGNRFYPKNISGAGTTLSGTITDSTSCATPHTIRANSDAWEVWNAGISDYLAQLLSTSTYSLTSSAGCTYTITP